MPQPFIIGLIVNPVAGLGGPIAQKGSDAPNIRETALAAGVEPQAPARARRGLEQLVSMLGRNGRECLVMTGEGELGADAVAGLCPVELLSSRDESVPERTGSSAIDTRRLAAAIKDAGAELLLFAGGDGTARDILDAVGPDLPVVGIPAGVKIYSAAFALTPVTGGSLAAAWLISDRRQTSEREVVDIDEDALRAGSASPSLHGWLRVPVDPSRLQDKKTPTPASDNAAVAALARTVAGSMVPGRSYVLGPGGTTHAVGRALGLEVSRLGVDVVRDGLLLARDVTSNQLAQLIAGTPATVVLTPLGGQGFIVGRGNQQLTAALIGGACVQVIATPAKLASLGGSPLHVDTGSTEGDARLSGFVKILTGPGTATVYPVGNFTTERFATHQ